MFDAYPEYIEEFSIEIANFNPIGPTAYIPLPETLPKHNNRIINIQNDDDYGERIQETLPKCKGLNNAPQRPQMPLKNKSIKAFYNYKCMQPNPYRIFWDLEMLTEMLTPEEKTKLTHTERLQMHKPCGYCYVVVRMDSSLKYEIMSHDLYRGPDTLERFVTKIEEELLAIQEDLSALAEMIMAPGDLKSYNEATECWICKKAFFKPSQETLEKFEEAKYRLLEVNE
ncbi:hypothetical protein C2G38_2176282 [Gigaspora rosea]|uniref:Uncharacterized protein n=1 Tax=Gigaspora rosea TaxID=44941 RepID=A0A397VQW7_9GLOM|nr:hypothetical protein C2G38_2176282 [Gigaspora rosea]